MKIKLAPVLHTLLILAVLAVVVTGFIVVGPPSLERSKRLDETRANALQQIASSIEQYYNYNATYTLPSSLQMLAQDQRFFVGSILDPANSQPYGYTVNDGTSYNLCANFETDTLSNLNAPSIAVPMAVYPAGVMPTNTPNASRHPAGFFCYTITVNKYPYTVTTDKSPKLP